MNEPKPYPEHSFVSGPIPKDFNDVIVAVAAKNKTLYWDQLLALAQAGAECSRLHQGKKR